MDLQEPFKVCIVQISTLPWNDWITALDFLKFIKSKMAGHAGMRKLFIEIENFILENGVDQIIAKPWCAMLRE